MLSPKKMKFRKMFKGKVSGLAYTGAELSFGSFGLKALAPGRMSANQMEAVRRCVARSLQRKGKFWNRLFPHLPVTAKPIEVRMGGGKGGVDRYVARIYPGSVLFELEGVTFEAAKKAFELASAKLPFAVKFVKREEGVYATYN